MTQAQRQYLIRNNNPGGPSNILVGDLRYGLESPIGTVFVGNQTFNGLGRPYNNGTPAKDYQTGGESNWYQKYWEGKVRSWFSLEMVSLGGSVHFYIWGPGKMKATIEQQLYSQYPGIEVFEVEDYSHMIDFEKGKVDASVLEYDLARPSPYPIKTYVDFGLDKAGQDEEFKIDPLTTLLEYLGSLRPGEQAWIQIMIRAHKAERKVSGKDKPVDWKYDAEQEIHIVEQVFQIDFRLVR